MSKPKEEIITRTKDQHLKILCSSIGMFLSTNWHNGPIHFMDVES